MNESFLPWIVISVSAVSRRPAPPRLLAAVLVFLAVQSTAVASLGTPLLPTVQRVERVSLAASQWTLTITLLAGAGPGTGLGLDVGCHPRRGGHLDGAAGRRDRLGAARSASAGRTAAARPPAGTGRQPHRLPDRRRLLPADVARRPLRPDAARGRLRPRCAGGGGRGHAHPVLPG